MFRVLGKYNFAHTITRWCDRKKPNRPVIPGCAMAFQIMADQLTLSQPGGEDYAHHINSMNFKSETRSFKWPLKTK